MELMPVMRILWSRKAWLTFGAVVAVAAWVALGGERSVTTSSAVAWTRVAVDTPRSQLVATAPAGSGTLAWRASLLMHLMATQASTDELARRLDVRRNEVTFVDRTLSIPRVPASIPQRASDAAAVTAAPYVVTAYFANSSLPVISIEAAGP